jgi:hypothetical protein
MSYQNSRLVEWSLLIFSTFITVISIINVVEYVNIINGPDNPNFTADQARGWLIANCILLFVAIIYWVYRIYHFFLTPDRRTQTFNNIKQYLGAEHNGFIGETTTSSGSSKSSGSSGLKTVSSSVSRIA